MRNYRLLSYPESKLVSDSIDSIIVSVFDQINERQKQLNEPSANISSLFTNVPFRNWIFKVAQNRLKGKIETSDYYQAEVLRRAVDNFEDTLRFYSERSTFLRNFEVEQDLIDEEGNIKTEAKEGDDSASQNIVGDSAFNRSGNDKSIDDGLANEVKYLISTITEKDEQGNDKLNALGFPKLVSFDRMKNRLAKMLQGIADENDMYTKMVESIDDYSEHAQLVARIGDPSDYEGNHAKFNLWMKFRQGFAKHHVPLMEQLIERTKDGIQVKLARAKPDLHKVRADFSSNFIYALPEENPYITIKDGQNVLNIENLVKDIGEKYTDTDRNGNSVTHVRFKKGADASKFFTAIGAKFDDKDSIKKEVKKLSNNLFLMSTLLDGLFQLDSNGYKIVDLSASP